MFISRLNTLGKLKSCIHWRHQKKQFSKLNKSSEKKNNNVCVYFISFFPGKCTEQKKSLFTVYLD